MGALFAAAGVFQIWEFIRVVVLSFIQGKIPLVWNIFLLRFCLLSDQLFLDRGLDMRLLGMSCSLHFTCWNELVLTLLYNLPRGPSANLWRFDEETKEFSAIAIMLQDLLYRLFDGYGDEGLASSKCMELRNSVYVFK